MNKYTELSDFEINKKIAEILKLNTIAYERTEIVLFDDMDATPFNSCNNPSDAMPIIIENNISLRAPTITDRWKAEFIDEYGNYVGYRRAMNKNPLRAAMELFLLMKDAENNQ
ncbi:phage protein NinX family protein [Proteus mirabilis]|uniref:phage protein NinX family protein n=1 Tax=Proteus mirabilis TaxID=584 RepID=UPI0008F8C5B3|nr:phage protein NinX family protein [Proteus mirabilis]OIK46547.1 hypothetical protein BE839_04615 [Proteus mirabilis]TFT66516.1 DUF2591 domain-containing protein [Proteus mirabilis]